MLVVLVVGGTKWRCWLVVKVFLGCSIRMVDIGVGWVLLVFVVDVAVGSMYLWLLLSGGWCGGCGWVCGSFG